MTSVPLMLLVGFLAGFFGAIPPGPLNVTVIRKTSRGEKRAALRAGLGGALVDTLICALLGLGLSWILEKVVTNGWVKLALSLFLCAYGLKILIVDRKRDAEACLLLGDEKPPPPPGLTRSFLLGLFQGAANPTILVNWTLVLSFLVGHGLLKPGAANASAFALGVGLGVFGWFAILTELVDRLKDHSLGHWLRESTVLAGVLLILFGLWFSYQSMKALAA